MTEKLREEQAAAHAAGFGVPDCALVAMHAARLRWGMQESGEPLILYLNKDVKRPPRVRRSRREGVRGDLR